LFLCLAFSIAPSLLSQTASTPGCTVEKGYYHCNQAAFLAALNEAKTVAVESRPFDQATTDSLGKLVRALNKTEVSSSGDLTLVLIRTQAEGIFYGPSDRELASFLVYSASPQGTEKQLIWIETFNGEPDLVWPIVVYDIIRQFKTSLQ
jgi:hypothetical protein